MIDSLNGYRQSMPDESLPGRPHASAPRLPRTGWAPPRSCVNEVSNLTGDFSATQFGLSYLADTVIVLKYYEYGGALHKAIGTLKKRLERPREDAPRIRDHRRRASASASPLPMLRGILRGEAEAGEGMPFGRPWLRVQSGGGP